MESACYSTNLHACNASAADAVDAAVEAETSPCSSSSSAVSKRTKMSSTRGEESYALQAGTKVIGYFRGLKQETGWYGATIADVLVDNDTDGADRIRYRVDWDDGDTRDTHKTSVDIAIVMANLQLNPRRATCKTRPAYGHTAGSSRRRSETLRVLLISPTVMHDGV